jgi:hypothetical protein
MVRSVLYLPGIALFAVLVGVGCEEKKPSTEVARTDAGAGTDKYATADPKLAKALQAAASASASAGNGPPPEGIFAEGVADQRHPRGAPTTVSIVTDGSDPRVSLQSSAADASSDARPTTFGRAEIELAMQNGPRNGIVLDFGLSLGPAKKDDGGPDWLLAEVRKAVPSDRQMGQLPPGTDKDIASLNGTVIRVKWTPDGRESELDVQPAKSAHAELERFAMGAAEVLVFTTVPLPPKPVGVGAQWIAESRIPLAGLDVLAYRAYRVTAIEGDRVRLALNVKAYAANTEVKLQGVPKGATLQQFDAQSQGELDLVRGEVMARKSDIQQRVVMVFQAAGGAGATGAPGGAQPAPPGSMLSAQLQSEATMVRGEPLRAAAK